MKHFLDGKLIISIDESSFTKQEFRKCWIEKNDKKELIKHDKISEDARNITLIVAMTKKEVLLNFITT